MRVHAQRYMKGQGCSAYRVHWGLTTMDPTKKTGAKLQPITVKTCTVLGILIDMMYTIGFYQTRLRVLKPTRGIPQARISKIFCKK